MQVSIVICTHNRGADLAETLTRLADCERPEACCFETLVIANGCDDKTMEVCCAAGVRAIAEPKLGLSHARNTAIATTSGAAILWLDDDVTPNRSLLTSYCRALHDHPEAAFFGGPIRPVLTGRPPDWAEFALKTIPTVWSGLDLGNESRAFDTLSRNEYPYGANMLVRRTAIGDGFRANLGRCGTKDLVGGEDRELFRRLAAAGMTGRWLPAAAVEHRIGADRQSLDYVARYFRAQGQQLVRLTSPSEPFSLTRRFRSRLRLLYEAAKFAAGRTFRKPDIWLAAYARRNKVIGMREAGLQSLSRSRGP